MLESITYLQPWFVTNTKLLFKKSRESLEEHKALTLGSRTIAEKKRGRGYRTLN